MNRHLVAIFLFAFAVALVVTAPLALALRLTGADTMGLSAANVSGSIWNGYLQNLSLRGKPLGDVRARIDPLSLVTGVSRLHLQSDDGAAVLLAGRRRGFERLSATVSLKELGFALPMDGTVSLKDAALVFAGGNCEAGNGAVTTDMFQHGFAGPSLTGNLSCADGHGIARLTGKNENFDIAVTVRLRADGHYRLDTMINAVETSLQTLLAGAGFTQRGKAWERSDEGRLTF